MNKKVLYVILAVLVLVAIGLYVYNQNGQNQTASDQTNQNTATTLNQGSDTSTPLDNTTATHSTPPAPTTPDNTHFSDESDIGGGSDVQVREVTFNGTSFSPTPLTIKVGDIVVFKNESTKAFWPASAPHHGHTNYPEFDAKKAIAPGGDFQFKFTKVGTWAYHDHLTPTAFGSIVVTQ